MKIVVVAGDLGSARCIEPVIRALSTMPGVELSCRPYKLAVDRWQQAGISATPLESTEDIDEELKDFSHALVATSVGDTPRELQVIELARRRRARSVAVLDHWTNYRERFLIDDRLVLPDAVAVMDARAQDEMSVAGFPRDRLVVTGHPLLEETVPASLETRREQAKKLTTELSIGAGKRVLWASQPFACGPTPGMLGFKPEGAFRGFARALDRHAETKREPIRLLFKPHPREGDIRVPNVEHGSFLHVHQVPVDYPARDAVLGADLVAGMQTMLLLEAAMLGIPTISFQPGLKLPDPLPLHFASSSYSAYDDEALMRALPEALSGQPPTAKNTLHDTHAGATERIIRLLLQPN